MPFFDNMLILYYCGADAIAGMKRSGVILQFCCAKWSLETQNLRRTIEIYHIYSILPIKKTPLIVLKFTRSHMAAFIPPNIFSVIGVSFSVPEGEGRNWSWSSKIAFGQFWGGGFLTQLI
jgi:hypothetical protein